MILDFIIRNAVAPVIALIIKIIPTVSIPQAIMPYIATAVGFFAELYNLISYFVPLEFFFLVISLKTGFYAVKLIIKLIGYIGTVL